MDIKDNVLFSITVLPVSTEQTLGGSVLPDRFVSSSKSQPSAIMGGNLGSTAHLARQPITVVIPAIIA